MNISDLWGGSPEDDGDLYGTGGGSGSSFTTSENSKARGDAYGKGYTMGSLSGMADRSISGQAQLRPDQTGYERLAEQRGNYFYGGYAGGQQDAINAARANVGKYANTLGGYGSTYETEMGKAAGREAPVDAFGVGASQFGAGNMFGNAGTLRDLAMAGPGPSAAQAQLDASTATAARQQLMLAQAGRGTGGGAAATRQAMANQAQIQGAANAQAAVLRAQEEDAWRQQQARLLGMSGEMYGAGAGTALAGSQYSTGAQQAQNEMNDRYALGMGGLASQSQRDAGMMTLGGENLVNSINMGGLQGSSGYEQLLAQMYGISSGVGIQQQQINQQQNAADMSFYGTLLSDVSDIRAKENIRPADGAVRDTLRRAPTMAESFSQDTGLGMPVAYDADSGIYRPGARMGIQRGGPLDERRARAAGAYTETHTGEGALADRRARARVGNVPSLDGGIDPSTAEFDARDTSASAYEYRDPARHGAGTHVGPMAQELEKTPAGATAVITQPDGTKAVDTSRLSLLNTSGLGEVQRQQDETNARLDEIEGLLPASEDKPAAKRKAKKAGLSAYERRYAEEMAQEAENDRYNARLFRERTGSTEPIAYRKGRNIPMVNLDEPGTGSARAPRGTQFSDEPSQEEQDEIERNFYDPRERYRTYAL